MSEIIRQTLDQFVKENNMKQYKKSYKKLYKKDDEINSRTIIYHRKKNPELFPLEFARMLTVHPSVMENQKPEDIDSRFINMGLIFELIELGDIESQHHATVEKMRALLDDCEFDHLVLKNEHVKMLIIAMLITAYYQTREYEDDNNVDLLHKKIDRLKSENTKLRQEVENLRRLQK